MVVNGQKGSHNDEAGILGEGGRRKEKERKGKERKGKGRRERLSISTRNSGPFFFFIFLFFVFPFWSLERGDYYFLFSSPVNSSNYFSCLQGVVITLPTKRPKRPPKQSLKLGVGTREKVWGEGSNRRIEGEGEKEKVKSAAATMIDRLGGFRREVRRWMEKGNTGDDREAGELDSS